jgi:4'-phosphopantetheinyl transferase EntD
MPDADGHRFSGPWPLRRVANVADDDDSVPAGLFDDDVEFESIDPTGVSLNDIHPRERMLVATAVDSRQREFAAGRICARRALGRLGASDAPLLADSDRMPIWPDGFAGSISHVSNMCGAAVTRRPERAGVGFDIEYAEPLPTDAWRIVLTENERSTLSTLDEHERGIRARLIFSAKESFYKCYRGTGGGWLDFDEVELRLTARSDDIELVLHRQLGGNVLQVEGRYAITPRFIYTAFVAR